MVDCEKLYEKLMKEHENYQSFAEKTIQSLNEKNIGLEKKLDSLSNIIEITKYINSNLNNENLISMINDMIVGIIGATYSSIYLKENEMLTIKATNLLDSNLNIYEHQYFRGINMGEPFIVNSIEPLFYDIKSKVSIHSIVGVPIYIRNQFMGYIIAQQSLYDFFNNEHMKFITAIANQIGIALENNFLYNKVKEMATRDPLLGIYNRRHFFELVETKIEKSMEKDFAIVMMDLDSFKKVNDIYGHQFGDEVLIQTSKVLLENVSKDDVVARYGGEEIVIYIDNAYDRKNVFKRVDDIRIKISENIIEYGEINKGITASFGIGYYTEFTRDLKKVLNIADNMMYEAKRLGKNRVMSA